MRGTGQFEIATAHISAKMNRPFSIVFFGDVHYGCPAHAAEAFDEFLERYRHRPDTYFIGMGDYLDMFSASERTSWKNAPWHESTEETVEGWHTHRLAEFAEKIKFMRGRLLGMIEGNHHIRFSDGTTTAMRLCQDLGTQYLGDCALLHVVLDEAGCRTGQKMSFDMALHHGVGGGRTSGAQFNSLDQMAASFEGCSIYAMGDNHGRSGIAAPDKLYLVAHQGKLDIKARPIYLVRTGSFMRSYVPGTRSYVVDKQMRPSNLGSVRMDFIMQRKRTGPQGRDGSVIDLKIECVN